MNRHRRRFSLRSAIATAVLVAVVAAGASAKTSTGRKQITGGVSQEQLEQLGDQAFAEAKSKLQQSQDQKQLAYVRCVVDAIARELPPKAQRPTWDVAVFVSEEPNAFALPGGKIGIYTGLFGVAKNQDQLAAVIGHEIGHVAERHHDERITRQLMARAGVGIAGALLGSRYGENAAQTTNQLGGIAAQGLIVLPNSRIQEKEADIVGQRLIAQAGFDPRQAENLWQNMIVATRGSRAPQWLSTHPDPKLRIGELRKRADQLMPAYEQARAAGRKPKCG
jgi:predicted Zn-dependent protease